MSDASTIEVTAPDIESAIAKGVSELGVSRDDVIVEVLEEPTRRLLGLGTKQAKVRLTVIGMRPKPQPAAPVAPVSQPVEPVVTPPPVEQASTESEPAQPKPRPEPVAKHFKPPAKAQPGNRQTGVRRSLDRHPPEVEEPEEVYIFDDDDDDAPSSPVSEEDLAAEAKLGADTLRELLKRMDIEAKVAAHPADTDGHEAQHWTLEIHGRDLGNLIGRKGETLSALQYITRLITSKELNRRANLVIDVEGYKSRRETMLKRLAKRMADQAIQRGRTVQLEPMPPHERRIIHLTLRDYPGVRTESVGDGDHRKVTIIPSKE
jgi:spoIIIJ-associated protein